MTATMFASRHVAALLYYVNPGDTPYVVTGIAGGLTKADGTSADAKNAPRRPGYRGLEFSREELAPAAVKSNTLHVQTPGGTVDEATPRSAFRSYEHRRNTIRLKARTPAASA